MISRFTWPNFRDGTDKQGVQVNYKTFFAWTATCFIFTFSCTSENVLISQVSYFLHVLNGLREIMLDYIIQEV